MTPQCNLCGHQGKFLNPDRDKEGWHCTNCSSSSRNRMVMHALGKMLGLAGQPAYLWPQNKNFKILEPCPRGFQATLLREKFDYFEPEFDAEKIKAGADPRKYADIQNLAFADETFDAVIASEVFEHVREDHRGFQEVYRVLKRDGTFIMTVPYNHQRLETLVCVQVEGDRDVFLTEPRYHGGGGATLEYRQYGRDVLSRLRQVGFAVGYVECAIPRYQIHPHGFMICKKSDYFDLSALWSSAPDETPPFRSLGPLLPFRLFVLYKFQLKSVTHFLREIKRNVLG